MNALAVQLKQRFVSTEQTFLRKLSMAEAQKKSGQWWGKFKLEENMASRWKIACSSITLVRSPQEWRLIRAKLDCHEEHEVEFESDFDWRKESAEDAETVRYGMSTTSPDVQLVPMLADRMVVVRPEIPFNIIGGQKVRIFVRTPIWLSVETGRDKIKLSEAPVERMSDTWFGPSTVEGQLCYAARTHGVMDINEVTKVRHRAITVINIENEGKEAMYVERLNVPVKNLALYADGEGYFWSDSVRVTVDHEKSVSDFKIAGKPEIAGKLEPVSPAREKISSSLFSRARGYLVI